MYIYLAVRIPSQVIDWYSIREVWIITFHNKFIKQNALCLANVLAPGVSCAFYMLTKYLI